MLFTFSNQLLLKQKLQTVYVARETPGSGSVYLPISWWYRVWIIGAGGGAGGGSYGKDNKSAGWGAGGGSGFIGDVFLNKGTYTYSCGNGGAGGGVGRKTGNQGHDGGKTFIRTASGDDVITAGAGSGGASRWFGGNSPEGTPCGRGGILTIASSLQQRNVQLSRNGNGASGYNGGAALYAGYGRGGGGAYKGTGGSGKPGYIKIELQPV